MDWNDRVIDDWESKWLDPDYDIASGRYREDREDEESERLELESDEELNDYMNALDLLAKKFLRMGAVANA